jgi:hypothetical protein
MTNAHCLNVYCTSGEERSSESPVGSLGPAQNRKREWHGVLRAQVCYWTGCKQGGLFTQQLRVSQYPALNFPFDVSVEIAAKQGGGRSDPMMVFKSLRPDTLNVDKQADS